MATSEPTEQHLQDIGSIGRMLAERITEVARLQALVSEQAREIARLVEAGQAYIDAYDAALKALPNDERAEERCHTQRYNLRAALAARGAGASVPSSQA